LIFNKTIKVQYYKKTLNDPDVAKDVVQKVMKYIWENSDKLGDNSPIAPYVPQSDIKY